MYRAFAPFSEGVRGDRRVTGCNTIERQPHGIVVPHVAVPKDAISREFSREFIRQVPPLTSVTASNAQILSRIQQRGGSCHGVAVLPFA